MQPLVTVITPVYNCEKYIEDTIYSVMDQEYGNIHYIVIDDGSTDETWEKMCNHQYSNYFIRLSQENKGEQETVNYGLSRVTGKYFMIVNGDDQLRKMAVPTLVKFMEAHPDVLCAYPDWISMDEKGRYGMHVTSMEYDFGYMVRHHTCLPSVGSIFRSDVIKMVGYRDTSYRWLGDFDYWLRIGEMGDMARVPHTLAYWRHRNGQESAAKCKARAEEHIRIMDEFFKRPWNKLAYEKEARCWSYLVAASVSSSKKDIADYVGKAFKLYPQILGKLEFYDALARRALYILRR